MRRNKNRRNYRYDPKKDKAVMFFSASAFNDAMYLIKSEIWDILVSYHYIKKAPHKFVEKIMKVAHSNGGLFMTDSGAFSFFSNVTDEMYKEDYWIDYIEEYVSFLEKYADYIYCAANMDLDIFVGQEVVDKWNKKYFEPLHDRLQIIYIAHGDKYKISHDDPRGLHRFKEYAKKYDYVGVGSSMFRMNVRQDDKYYVLARRYNVRVHGFGWTSIPSLKEFPFFSVDSTTWLGGARYGTTYQYDGANDRVIDYKKKHTRKVQKSLCRDIGIDYEALMKDDRHQINLLNLHNWKGFRREFLKAANVKLRNKNANYYGKNSRH